MTAVTGVARTRAELASRTRDVGPDRCARADAWAHCTKGHRSLMRRAREIADQTVVSIFVNPLQFAAGEDLDRYPRPLDADLAMCAEEGVALAFVPSRDRDVSARAGRAGGGGRDRCSASRARAAPGTSTACSLWWRSCSASYVLTSRCSAARTPSNSRSCGPWCADLEPAGPHRGCATHTGRRRARVVEPQRYLTAQERSRCAGVAARAASWRRGGEQRSRRRRRLWPPPGRCSTAQPGVDTDYVALVDPDTFEDVAADGSASSVRRCLRWPPAWALPG